MYEFSIFFSFFYDISRSHLPTALVPEEQYIYVEFRCSVLENSRYAIYICNISLRYTREFCEKYFKQI